VGQADGAGQAPAKDRSDQASPGARRKDPKWPGRRAEPLDQQDRRAQPHIRHHLRQCPAVRRDHSLPGRLHTRLPRQLRAGVDPRLPRQVHSLLQVDFFVYFYVYFVRFRTIVLT